MEKDMEKQMNIMTMAYLNSMAYIQMEVKMENVKSSIQMVN